MAGTAAPGFRGKISAEGLISVSSDVFPEFSFQGSLPSAITKLWQKKSSKRPRGEG